ncbi:MAG: hypothetical protein PHE67_13810, partial [Campylobacterales bacterium]|nr:hypothetical protein [Campylobacterales bacterium]
ENDDGTVLTMLHSVLWTIEVKTNLKSSVMAKAWRDAIAIMGMACEIEGYGDLGDFASISTNLMAYKCAQKLDTIEKSYEKNAKPLMAGLDIYIMRFPEKEMPNDIEIGGELHMEPIFDNETIDEPELIDNHLLIFGAHHTPLSDFYYRLVQNCYYALGARNFSFNDIGAHFMRYMSWSTVLS